MPLDTQVVELLGRQRLIAELVRDDLEVALPVRDRGVDLIAYAELNTQVSRFASIPIQMKASTTSAFSVDGKYERIANLIIAYVWNLGEPDAAITYAMTFPQAVAIANEMGWTQTASWKVGQYYTTSKPSQKLLGLLVQYRMNPGSWKTLVTGSTVV